MSACFVYTCLFFFFFNDTATTEIYTLSLHDALPISLRRARRARRSRARDARGLRVRPPPRLPGGAARLARSRGRLSQRDGPRRHRALRDPHLPPLHPLRGGDDARDLRRCVPGVPERRADAGSAPASRDGLISAPGTRPRRCRTPPASTGGAGGTCPCPPRPSRCCRDGARAPRG